MSDALWYILQAARGLAYAHASGVVHRDIKPANLLVDDLNNLKILDMGLARLEGTIDPDRRELTQTGQVMGTLDYMAPEQAMDTHQADARSDIYALGCTLYRLLAGDVPFPGDTVVKKIMAHRELPIPRLRQRRAEVPAAIGELCARMMAKEPQDRPQTMSAVVAALDPLVPQTQSGSSATRIVVPPPLPAVGQSNALSVRYWMAGGVAVVLLIVVTLAIAIPRWAKTSATVPPSTVPPSTVPEPAPPDVGLVGAELPVVAPPLGLRQWMNGRTVLEVSQDGSTPYQTISAALADVRAHQVVHVLDAGPYHENLDVAELPPDCGLVSEVRTIVRAGARLNSNVAGYDRLAQRLHGANGFRLQGFTFIINDRRGKVKGVEIVGRDILVWGCDFGFSHAAPEQRRALRVEGSAGSGLVEVRDCVVSGSAFIIHEAGTTAVRRNFFGPDQSIEPLWITLRSTDAASAGVVLASQNVFSETNERTQVHIRPLTKHSAGTKVYLVKGTFLSNGAAYHIGGEYVARDVVIQDNLFDSGGGIRLSENKNTLAQAPATWQLGFNAYVGPSAAEQLAPTAHDIVLNSLSWERSLKSPDFARYEPGSPLDKKGRRGKQVTTIGALAPHGSPAQESEETFFKELMERYQSLPY